MNDWTSNSDPRLLRIQTATVSTPDLEASERCYSDFLHYEVVERGHLDASIAESWGTPAMAGTRYCAMVPQGEHDVFLRLVEGPEVPGYRPLTTFGWNAFEIIVDDVHALSERLASSPFQVIGPPRPLQFMPSIVAMQVSGPSGECLYFTMESGDRENSILPPPAGFVGRTFIVVSAGPDFQRMLRWYVDRFQLRERPVRNSKVEVIQRAQGLDPEQTIELSAIGMRQRGNLIELDGYLTGPDFIAAERPRPAGSLPPGNALVTVEVEDFDAHVSSAIRPPRKLEGAVYGGRRACTLVGPAGELLELVEPA